MKEFQASILRYIRRLKIRSSLDYHFHHINPFHLTVLQKQRFFLTFLRILKIQKQDSDKEVHQEEIAHEDKHNEKVSHFRMHVHFRAFINIFSVYCL